MKQWLYLGVVLVIWIAGCSPAALTETSRLPGQTGEGMGGMMGRHHMPVPEPYQSLSSPVEPDQASLERGAEVYGLLCATCHGDGGMGDGPAGANLDPPAAPVAHTSQMLGDAYLYWRIHDGGVNFQTAMPGWKDTLTPEQTWDVINYIRALGSGEIEPQSQAGGSRTPPASEAQLRADMLEKAVAEGAISAEEADVFELVHQQLDERLAALPQGSMADQAQHLQALVEEGEITTQQADMFTSVHNRLIELGYMQ